LLAHPFQGNGVWGLPQNVDQMKAIHPALAGMIGSDHTSGKSMSDSFDLTTKEGITNAYEKYGSILPWQVHAVKKAFDWISSLTDTKPTIEQQTKAAEDIIKAGRENNVDEIEIELEQTAGIDLNGKLKTGESIETKIGKSGKMKMKVKYKQ
jgi:hypothetical protein